MNMNTPRVGEPVVKKELLNEVKAWAQACEVKDGVLVVMRVMSVPKASRSMLDSLNNTGKHAEMTEEELKCRCEQAPRGM